MTLGDGPLASCDPRVERSEARSVFLALRKARRASSSIACQGVYSQFGNGQSPLGGHACVKPLSQRFI